MSWDWQVFCKNTLDGEVIASCFGSGGDITYLQWMMSAWGWTLSVALLALVTLRQCLLLRLPLQSVTATGYAHASAAVPLAVPAAVGADRAT